MVTISKFIKVTVVALLCMFSAGGWMATHGIAPPALTIQPTRSVYNVNFMDGTYDYELIDHVQIGGAGIVPIPTSYNTPAFWYGASDPLWNTDAAGAQLDSDGYPQNIALADNHPFGDHFLVPSSANYGAIGTYTVTWVGDCAISFTAGTWSNDTSPVSGTNFNRIGNGSWAGSNIKLRMNYSGAQQQIGWRVNRTGQFGGGYCHRLHVYRTVDEADFDAGLLFRSGFKSILVAQDPSAVRCMNWHGGNDTHSVRWENRAKYPSALYGGGYTTISLPYGQTTGTPPVYVLAAVSGTPASMQHGEVVTARLGGTIPRVGTFPLLTAAPSTPGAGQTQFTVNIPKTGTTNGTTTITGISTTNLTLGMSITGGDIQANSFIASIPTGSSITITNVATGSNVGEALTFGHGFVTGDVAAFRNSTSVGWTKLHFQNAAVTVVDPNTFYVTLDTTTYGTFVSTSSGANISFAGSYVSLQVGSGNDRVAYPVVDTQGYTSIGMAGSANFFHATDYRTFYFDKTIFASRDATGVAILGAWMSLAQTDSNTSLFGPAIMGTPIELCAQLVKELNNMGPAKPIHLWMNIPGPALMSMDPDYSAGSNYVVNATNAALAILPPNIYLYEEYNNENWNGPSATFTQNQYMMERTLARVPTQSYGITSYSYMSSLRSTIMVVDAKAAINDARLKFVLAGQGAVGISLGVNNYIKSLGTGIFYTDSAITALPTIAKTGSTHTNTTLDNLGSTANLTEGMGISGSNIQAGTQISSITNSTTVVMSLPATGTGGGIPLSFLPTPISYHTHWATASYFDPPTNHTATFTGAISGTTLTVSGFVAGGSSLAVGDFVVGAGVSTNPNTKITAFGSGTGTNGTYTVNVSQAVVGETMTKNQYMGYVTGTGTFTDDSAMYNGTNNTANGGGNYTGAANTAQAITNFVAQMVSGGDSQSMNFFRGLTTSYANKFSPLGISTIQYEGAGEWVTLMGLVNPVVYGGHTITANDQVFLLAVQASSNWSVAMQAFFTDYRANPSTYMPSIYLMLSSRWGYTPTTNANVCGGIECPDTYSGGVEGGAMSQTWTDNGAANQLLNFLLRRDVDPASNDNTPMGLEYAA